MAVDDAYLSAEQEIEAALRLGIKDLDLSARWKADDSMKLTELPESLCQLSQLQSLNLSGHKLRALPDSLGRLTKLKSLDLSHNKLTRLPDSLGKLAKLQSLDISHNQLRRLPDSLGQLPKLQSLELSYNKLTSLPDSLGQLTELQSLDLSDNQLTAMPDSLSQLAELQSLDLSDNQLTALPDSLSQLIELQSLDLSNNQFTTLPDSLSQLVELQNLYIRNVPAIADPVEQSRLFRNVSGLHALNRLDIRDNGLTTLSANILDITSLREIDLDINKLFVLPDGFSKLEHLERLSVSQNNLSTLPSDLHVLHNLQNLYAVSNPLNPELEAACNDGIGAVKRYLREMAQGGKHRYEAKLLILGDGNEGKTCVSRALRGLPFRMQKSTRGVDVVQWTFDHPDLHSEGEKRITLNIWDFEGQEISHQTHQFFLTVQSLYLLVFKCRDQFLMDRAEYWLDTIRARAPQAKVVIVISQCEKRSPHIPLDRIESQYREMLADEWLFTVGCENGKNIDKLKSYLQRLAADLDFMGSLWPISYEMAEAEIKAKAKAKTAHISRAKLNGILRKAGVKDDNYEGAAGAMARIGAITQFPDCPELRDFVVLKPQWLTKAISKVMEYGRLSDDKGEISLTQMEKIWSKAHYTGMFTTFHNCMKEFELCYDLEDVDDSCLVPLRFGYFAPAIPWTDQSGFKERRMEYKLNVRPPMGIISRFIVKTHHMIVKTSEHPKGVYWHNGVFLRTNSPCPSEALCEFVPDERIFRVHVRAAFPQNMCEQIHGYILAVFSFFGGLSAERSYGCIKVDTGSGAEVQCNGLHTEKRIYAAISKQREQLDCEFEDHEVDPRLLVSGISSFGGFVEERVTTLMRRELDRTPEWAEPFMRGIGKLLEWVQDNSDKLDQLRLGQAMLREEFKQETELRLKEYLACMSQMLDDRDHTAAPGLILITTQDRNPWNPVGYFKRTYRLTPLCESEGNIHTCEDGSVNFTKDREWWRATAPWIARTTKVLAAGLQLAFAGMPLALGSDTAKLIEDEVKFMEALTKHLELEMPGVLEESGTDRLLSGSIRKDYRANEHEAAITQTALARFLEETAPINYRARQWGSLRRIRMRDNSYRWLCRACATQAR